MAVLIVQFADRFAAGVFDRRAIIGRKPFNGVQLEHRTVSRIHAWIDKTDEGYVLNNSSKRSGTFVNGQNVTEGVILRDGDHITLGLAKLIFRQGNEVPEGAVTFDISDKGTNPTYEDDGILFHCQCGSPLWVPQSMAGAYGTCAHCKGDIIIPGAPLTGISRPLTPNDSIVDEPAIAEPIGSSARPEDPLAAEHPVAAAVQRSVKAKPFSASPRPRAPQQQQICSVCQGPITEIDPTTTCTACSQNYHSECWISNHGCAAYGCSQVGVLDPQPQHAAAAAVVARTADAGITGRVKERFPWEFALLGGSVLGSVIGAFTFGVPALAVGGASAVYAMKRRGGAARVAALSMLISAVGVAFGVMSSRFWWFDVPLWTWGRR